jgi:hypothetical protein
MVLKFKKTTTTNILGNWLKGFKDINPEQSLLLEVDLEKNMFIAKAFPKEKQILKYSTLTFEDAGLEIMFIEDNKGNTVENWMDEYGKAFANAARIKIGIFEKLSKIVNVVNMFSETPHDFIITFDKCDNIQYIKDNVRETEWVATSMIFKSMSLVMNAVCDQISEYFYKCSDETFLNVVAKIGSPISFKVSTETLNNLIKISDVFGVDKSRDRIKFYTKKVNDDDWGLYALDDTHQSFDYLLGYLDSGNCVECDAVINKDNFINAFKGLDTEDVLITLDGEPNSRIIIDSGNSKIVIAVSINS